MIPTTISCSDSALRARASERFFSFFGRGLANFEAARAHWELLHTNKILQRGVRTVHRASSSTPF